MKASEFKSKVIKINIGNKNYQLKFDINTLYELEEVYGDINQAF